MSLYKLSRDNLSKIEQENFSRENEIQKLVEENLETIFNLQFVSSEFSVGQFRLDTLCFDEETNSFVIIEYKNTSNFSVIDQGYSYLSTMLNKKADFILEYNEKTSKTLQRGSIDWSYSRVFFISPTFTAYQKNSVNFKDIPFELWEISKFSDGIIKLDKYQSDSNESIENLGNSNQNSVITAVASEVKMPTEEEHLEVASPEVAAIWHELRNKLETKANISFYAKKGYVGCRNNNGVICYVYFAKSHLRLEILRGEIKPDGTKSKGFFTLDDPKRIAEEKHWTYRNGIQGHKYDIKISDQDGIEYRMFLLQQRFDHL